MAVEQNESRDGAQSEIPRRPHSRFTARAVTVLVIVAFGVRMLGPAPAIISDSRVYDRMARAIAEGGPLWSTFRTPGYIVPLGALYAVFGSSAAVVRVAQASLGALTVFLTFLIGRRVGGSTVGLIAGLLTAVHPGLVLFSRAIMTETLHLFVLTLGLWLLVERRHLTPVGGALCGLVFGAQALVRPSGLFLLAPLWLVAFVQRCGRTRWIAAGLFVLGVELMCLPTQVHHYRSSGEFVLLDANAGVNFWIGNRPQAVGTYNLPKDWKDLPPFTGQNAYERHATGYREGWRSIAERPTKWTSSLPARAARFWWLRLHVPGLDTPRWLAIFDGALTLLACSLGAVGVWCYRKRRDLWPLYATILYFWALHTVSFTAYRFRLAVLPALFVAAALGGSHLWRQVRDQRGA